jgi:hypothetical protein
LIGIFYKIDFITNICHQITAAKLALPNNLEDKIFEIKYTSEDISSIVSYFPFSEK